MCIHSGRTSTPPVLRSLALSQSPPLHSSPQLFDKVMSDQLAKQTTKDYCHYTIHFPTTPSTSLPQLLAQSLAIVSTFSASYIWHNQPFNLSLSSLSFSSLPTSPQAQHLHGTTDVTDAVDDEWFIVFLLRQLSRELPQAVISVNDEDGEFLLIEAAEVLPRWVTPQNATNRVSSRSTLFAS